MESVGYLYEFALPVKLQITSLDEVRDILRILNDAISKYYYR